MLQTDREIRFREVGEIERKKAREKGRIPQDHMIGTGHN